MLIVNTQLLIFNILRKIYPDQKGAMIAYGWRDQFETQFCFWV